MRRTTRLRLVLSVGLLAVIAGVYSAYWFYAAARIREGLVGWRQSSRANKLDASWQEMRITGFPAAFQVELESAKLRDGARTPSPEFRAPSLSGSARPWDLSDWRLMAAHGFTADLAAPDDKGPVKLWARDAEGVVWVPRDGGWKLWLRLLDGHLETVSQMRVGSADAWIEAPPEAPSRHKEPTMAIGVAARQVEFPMELGPLGAQLDELDFAATVNGALPKGRLTDALAAWRDEGGTITLDSLHLRWGGLAATASGTFALNQELQPTAVFAGGIEGYDQILTALVDGGRMRASDAGLARIALNMLAKAGPDGKPEIQTSFTIQNGQMFLGPARLGKVPRLNWE